LIPNHLKIGLSKIEVFEILGMPDFANNETLVSYIVAMWSGFRIDYDSLDLELSAAGELSKYYRVQH